MSEWHTQERLVVRGTRIFAEGERLDCVASMQVANQANWEEDARRLAACWNACEGVPTKFLVEHPAPFSEMRAQRDELLEALKAMLSLAKREAPQLSGKTMGYAAAAIAKVTGEAL